MLSPMYPKPKMHKETNPNVKFQLSWTYPRKTPHKKANPRLVLQWMQEIFRKAHHKHLLQKSGFLQGRKGSTPHDTTTAAGGPPAAAVMMSSSSCCLRFKSVWNLSRACSSWYNSCQPPSNFWFVQITKLPITFAQRRKTQNVHIILCVGVFVCVQKRGYKNFDGKKCNFVVIGHREELKKFCLLQYFQPASSSFA